MRLFKKTNGSHLLSGIICFVFLLSSTTLHAHDFWVTVPDTEKEVFRADIGYGHDFPNPEPITADRTHLFEPLELVTADGKITLDQVGENYAFQKAGALRKGSYLVLGSYRPTFWSNGPDGWTQTDRLQRPDATYAQEAIMCAKTIINIQGAADDSLIKKPMGQRLEIVPLTNPADVAVGDTFPMRVLFDGKPLKTAVMEGTFAGFSDMEYKAFYGRTDLKGDIGFIPLKEGFWIVKVKHVVEHANKKRADELVLVSTLTFEIN